MPVFVYLIACKFFDKKYSLMAPLLVIFNFYFIFASNMGRVGIAWALFAGIIWTFLKQRYIIFGILMVMLIFTHYGTAAIALFSFAIVGAAMLFYQSKAPHRFFFLGMILVIIALGFIWEFLIAKVSGQYIEGFVKSVLVPKPILNGTDTVVPAALGLTQSSMNIPQRMEFYSSWLIVGCITLGFLITLKTREIPWEYTLLAVIMFAMIENTIISPFIAKYYGVVRVYFTAFPILAPYFIVFFKYVFGKRTWLGLATSYGLITFYGLCTSGLMHRFFGIVK
jgi:uncharacterized membrane protein